MGNLPNVNSGDLIRAEYINSLVAAINDLQTRVSKLEGTTTTGVRIDTITPPDPIVEGALVTIQGINFSSTTGNNTVTVAEVVITAFKAFGNDKLIQFDMPHIPSITNSAGSLVPITVRNSAGSYDTQLRTVRNSIPVPAGSGKVLYMQASVPNADGKIHAGDVLTFTFRVSATVTLPGSYLVTAGTDKGWQTQILGTNPFPLAAAPSGSQSTQDVTIQVTVPNGTPDGTPAVLSVAAAEVTPGSTVGFTPAPTVALTAGQAPQSPDSGIVLAPGPVSHGSFVGGGIQFTKSFPGGAVAFNLTFNKAGAFTIDFAMANPTGWTKQSVSNTTATVTTTPTLTSPSVTWLWDSTATATQMNVSITQQGSIVANYPIPVTLV